MAGPDLNFHHLNNLKLKYYNAASMFQFFYCREMCVVVATGNESVFGENGLIIVGGVLNLKDHETSDSAK